MKHNKLYCNHCFEYLEEIARLKDQLKAANAKINKQQRQIDEGHFGSSTPSSKKPPQPNTDQENKNKGGAQKGHVGSGRSKHDLNDADTTTEINFEAENCPDCGGELVELFTKNRSVIDIDHAKLKKMILLLKTKKCKSCKKLFSPKAPNVLPKFLYGNIFLAWLVNEHYIKGTTLGSLEKQTGVNSGTLISLLHKLAAIFKKVPDIQNIFREKENRLYHWAKDRSVPAENNFAERELRPLVISRKLSYGSHSDEGAKTREILMTVMHALKKNCDNSLEKMKNILNEYAKDSQEEAILKHF